jgi:DNA-binding NtrC family response regulator
MSAHRKLNMLVVDDAPSILRIVTLTLQQRLGELLDVTALSDAEEAALFLNDYCCDILLSDVEMPGMSGLEVVRVAKQRSCWTQAIVMTAHSTSERLATAMDNGACDYLLKPFKPDQLVEVVSECAHRVHRWQRALQGTLRPVCQ